MENNYDTVIKEKQRVQSLLESVQRRADDLDRSLEIANQKVEELKFAQASAKEAEAKCNDLEAKVAILEKDKETALRDIFKYRETIEVNIAFLLTECPALQGPKSCFRDFFFEREKSNRGT